MSEEIGGTLVKCESIPNDTSIIDGNTTLELEISGLRYCKLGSGSYESVTELPVVSGDWKFLITIPEIEPSPEFTVDTTPLRDTLGIPYANFQIMSSGCGLVMPDDRGVTDWTGTQEYSEDYDGQIFYAVEFFLKDDTKIPDFGSAGRVEDGQIDYIISWTPIDPETMDHVTVFDGYTAVELPIVPR